MNNSIEAGGLGNPESVSTPVDRRLITLAASVVVAGEVLPPTEG